MKQALKPLIVGEQLHPFPGGLAMELHKAVSCTRPIQTVPLPERLYLSLQHALEPPAQLRVQPGDEVHIGQPLTDSSDDFIPPIHAPACGKIVAIAPHPVAHPPGQQAPHLILATRPCSQPHEHEGLADWQECEPDQLIDFLHQAGLAGMGGAGFPVAAKLRGDWKPVHSLILNGAECEPWIACDDMLLREQATVVVLGGLILARAAGASELVIALAEHMHIAWAALQAALEHVETVLPIKTVQVFNRYPEGGERQLIQALTGHEVPHDGLPQDLGLLVHNVGTAAAACQAVLHGRPLIERIVTVTGPGIAQPCHLRAAFGTPLRDLVAAAGGYTGNVSRLVLGGPMMGRALADDRVSLDHSGNCILALTEEETRPPQPTLPCINCGACVEVCPAGLMPQTLYKLIAAGRHESAAQYHLSDCMECGACVQVCPSHIPLVDFYRHGKDELRRLELDTRQAELARRRHEAREARLERERQARNQRRREREARLARAGSAQDEILAAIERARKKKTDTGKPS